MYISKHRHTFQDSDNRRAEQYVRVVFLGFSLTVPRSCILEAYLHTHTHIHIHRYRYTDTYISTYVHIHICYRECKYPSYFLRGRFPSSPPALPFTFLFIDLHNNRSFLLYLSPASHLQLHSHPTPSFYKQSTHPSFRFV